MSEVFLQSVVDSAIFGASFWLGGTAFAILYGDGLKSIVTWTISSLSFTLLLCGILLLGSN